MSNMTVRAKRPRCLGVLVAGVVTLAGLAPTRAQPAASAPRPVTPAAAPAGDGWWCWSATTRGGAVRTGCVRDQEVCAARAREVSLEDVLADQLAAVTACRYQARAAVVTYVDPTGPSDRVAAFRTAGECRRHRQFLRRHGDDVRSLSSCALVGRTGAPTPPKRFAPERLGPSAPVVDTLSRDDVAWAVAAVRPTVDACRPRGHGRAVVAVQVARDGSVAGLRVIAATTPDLGACVVAALAGLALRPTTSGGSFSYPFSW